MIANPASNNSPASLAPCLIPAPRTFTPGEGSVLLDAMPSIQSPDPVLSGVQRYLEDWLRTLPLEGKAQNPTPAFHLGINPSLDPEAYSLKLSAEEIRLEGGDGAGVFYGVQTLIQLSNPWSRESAASAPPVCFPEGVVEDAPSFSYRGLHVDVGRHLFPVSFLKQTLEMMARYKLNRFHWHLTEDQGWRIEIKRYPRLQEIAAHRRESLVGHLKDTPHRFDGIPYGGFYTQEEIREIVAYARERFITVIPEIELPGHAQAAIAAYPELGCVSDPLEVATTWGIKKNVYCPSEETFTFLENVLTEVMELFPGEYIHIGGDECPKDQWKASPFCQQVMRENGLENEEELQSYFIGRIASFLKQHGRRIIGWDEILEGGLVPDATVMSWRGESGGIEAAKSGHDIIMTPSEFCYFDYYQADGPDEPLAIGGMLPPEKVYQYTPLPEALSSREQKHILGIQGSVWSEYIKTPEAFEYMVYPRAQALAEVAWSPLSKRNWEDFRKRLLRHLAWMRAGGINAADHLLRE
ncbi:MAG: beta-N-acetylhexosaminidase [Oceanipulchritudo sp.]